MGSKANKPDQKGRDSTRPFLYWSNKRSHSSPVTLLKKCLQMADLLMSERARVLRDRALSFRGLRGEWQYACYRSAGLGLIEAQLVQPLAQTG